VHWHAGIPYTALLLYCMHYYRPAVSVRPSDGLSIITAAVPGMTEGVHAQIHTNASPAMNRTILKWTLPIVSNVMFNKHVLYSSHPVVLITKYTHLLCRTQHNTTLHYTTFRQLVSVMSSSAVFLSHRAAARYRALVSIIPVRERFCWNLSF